MLSRDAQGLYWMSRHLERARHGCRLLRDQLDTIEDRPVERIDRSWRRLYRALGRVPLGGHMEANRDDEDFMLADAYTLADDLTFESGNPGSIRNCLAAARENARQVRNAVGDDMWASLNLAWLDVRDIGIDAIWNDRPGAFYARVEDAVRAFSGVAESVMYRDDAWRFLRLGRFVERAQLLTALLDAHIALFPTDEADGEADWRSLLGICEARFAWRRLHSLDHRPDRAVDFLVADARLAHSIRHALGEVADALDAVSGNRRAEADARLRVGRMTSRIDRDWPGRDPGDDDAARAALRDIGASCRRLHDDISVAWFDYEIGDAT